MGLLNNSQAGNKAVFLDRDGVIIKEKNYLHKVEDVEFIDGAITALKKLQDTGFHLVVVTNQSGVGRGYFTMQDVQKVHNYIEDELSRYGVRFSKIYIAPEAPDQPSRGRKPSPAFLFDARDEFGIDLAKSYVIGDKLADLECGWNAGVKKCILVRTGYGMETEQQHRDKLAQALIVNDITEAVEWILKDSNPSNNSYGKYI